MAGPTGVTGPTGLTGPTGPVPDDIFASFANFQYPLTSGTLISVFPEVIDTTGNIVLRDLEHIKLEPGYYLISYRVSALFRESNYMQITPFYNGTSHLENGIYFATSAAGASATGAAFFILNAPAATELSLSFTGSANATDGEINMTILKLRRTT